MIPTLRKGDKGDAVYRWQVFLFGQGFDPKGAEGTFGRDTLEATLAFQRKHRLDPDGAVGNETYGVAARLGFPITVDTSTTRESTNWPPAPRDFGPTNAERRDAEFGWFDFTHEPKPRNYEHIRIHPPWESENLITVEVPQLASALGRAAQRARIHRKIRDPFLALWEAWEGAGLLDRVLTWEGAFSARFIRAAATPANVRAKNRNKLSNHAWGTAFDINYEWNKLGKIPAQVGRRGCVRELVPLANKHGFYWGGHFRNRPDGMHFEWGAWK